MGLHLLEGILFGRGSRVDSPEQDDCDCTVDYALPTNYGVELGVVILGRDRATRMRGSAAIGSLAEEDSFE